MAAPARIVSLVPSLTELVFWLGRGETLVGRTRFCIEPVVDVAAVADVGGTKDPDVDKIIELRPDLVIANREENRREDVEGLRAAGLKVLLTDPNTVAEARDTILDLGDLLDARAPAAALARDIAAEMSQEPPAERLRVLVAVWHRPFMALGARSYGHDIVEVAGAENVLGSHERYPEVDLDSLDAAQQPDLILLPDEPYRFSERHVARYEHVAPAVVVDGKLLWWYGPRIPEAIRSLRSLFAAHAVGGRAGPA